MSNLQPLTENIISQLVYEQKSFTAYHVTKELRDANPALNIKHDVIRNIVHHYMLTPVHGYKSENIEVSPGVWALQYFYYLPKTAKLPVTPVSPVVIPSPSRQDLKITYDKQGRLYIAATELRKLGIKPHTPYTFGSGEKGAVLDFSQTQGSSKRTVSSRGYIRFKSSVSALECYYLPNKIKIALKS